MRRLDMTRRNGCDLEWFRYGQVSPGCGRRASVRTELGLSPDTLLIGLCARFNPQRTTTFIRAAGLLSRKMPPGSLPYGAIVWTWPTIAHRLDCHREPERAHTSVGAPRSPAGGRTGCIDPQLLLREAFPLVVGEAMSCAVPCVVTDVGDAAHIVGETGRSVPPSSPEALAAAWVDLLSLPADERRRWAMRRENASRTSSRWRNGRGLCPTLSGYNR
jgi:hypothetical protein